jgi:hypothetical protein
LLRRARDIAERIEGRILEVMNKHSSNGADGAARSEGTEDGTPQVERG